MEHSGKRYGVFRTILICFVSMVFVTCSLAGEGSEPGGIERSTADHSKFAALKKDFSSGPEVTDACLTCHTEAAAQLHESIHWTWREPSSGDDEPVGKGGLTVNNY